jgi:hypothetical protein
MRWRRTVVVLCFPGLLWALAATFIHEPAGSARPSAPTFTVAQAQYGLIHHRAQWANCTVWLHAWLSAGEFQAAAPGGEGRG